MTGDQIFFSLYKKPIINFKNSYSISNKLVTISVMYKIGKKKLFSELRKFNSNRMCCLMCLHYLVCRSNLIDYIVTNRLRKLFFLKKLQSDVIISSIQSFYDKYNLFIFKCFTKIVTNSFSKYFCSLKQVYSFLRFISHTRVRFFLKKKSSLTLF